MPEVTSLMNLSVSLQAYTSANPQIIFGIDCWYLVDCSDYWAIFNKIMPIGLHFMQFSLYI